MPHASAEEGPCPHCEGATIGAPAKELSGSGPLPFHPIKRFENDRDRFVRATPGVVRSDHMSARPCSFHHAGVCLVGEFHPGFRKGAGSRGDVDQPGA